MRPDAACRVALVIRSDGLRAENAVQDVGLLAAEDLLDGQHLNARVQLAALLSALKVQEEVVGLRLNFCQFRNSLSGGGADVEGHAL